MDTQILSQLVMVEFESGVRSAVSLEELEILPQSAITDQKQNNNSKKKGKNNKK